MIFKCRMQNAECRIADIIEVGVILSVAKNLKR
jgi:hypothetical protein